MPRELSPSEEREFSAYQALGPLEDVRARLGKLPKVQKESAERRERIDALEKENGELKGRVPEGAVVLTGDEAKAYEAVKGAGRALKDVDASLKRLAELETKDAARTREDSWRRAAKPEGLDPDKTVAALSRLQGFAELPFETKRAKARVSAAGREEEREDEFGFVTVDGKILRLGEYLAEHADFLIPGLRNGGGTADSVGRREVPDQRGNGGGGGKATSVFDRVRESARKEYTSAEGTPTVDTLAKRLASR